MTMPDKPDFQDPEFLTKHIHSILDFYEPIVRAADGGFYQCFKDDGTVYDTETRHLVSSTRFVFNYATAYRIHGIDHYRQWAESGLAHLQRFHRQDLGHYAWVLRSSEGNDSAGTNLPGAVSVVDGSALAYGHAFVMLAAASCVNAGMTSARDVISHTWDFVNEHFWDDDHGAYADERDSTLARLDPYRGQNANMHMCEALLAAWQATRETHYLDRAEALANKFAIELAAQSNGLIWEHYDSSWNVDMQYNIDKPDDLFKPWGFQPGHQVEWCKLLLMLNTERPDPKWPIRASELYDAALTKGWDEKHGGLVYGFAPDGSFCDSHKYFWVQAEAFAAAYRLFKLTDEQKYLDDYNRLWSWSWDYLIDHEKGAWFRIRNRDGSAFDDLKSPPGKTDYHTMGACWDVLSQQ